MDKWIFLLGVEGGDGSLLFTEMAPLDPSTTIGTAVAVFVKLLFESFRDVNCARLDDSSMLLFAFASMLDMALSDVYFFKVPAEVEKLLAATTAINFW